jgi:uncharacterized membrane protein
MMREEDKPFICYRQGKWGMKIVPRGGAGWRLMAYWTGLFLAILGLFILASTVMEANGKSDNQIALLIVPPFLVATLIWTVAMIRWMYVRSEIIDMEELIAIKRARDAAAKRGRR